MAELVKDIWRGMPLGLYLILFFAFGLMVASFIVPPTGVISTSVLQGIAIIIGGTWLMYVTANIPNFLEKGAKIKATYGNASIEIHNAEKNDIQKTVEKG